MSETIRQGGATSPPTHASGRAVQATEATGWVGWVGFAGVMMLMLGVFHAVEGLIAIFEDEYFLVGRSGLTVHLDFTVWGWVHLLGGVLVAAAGFAVFAGKIWARALGVVIALVSAVVNLGFLAAYPIWSTIMIAVDILIIWALTVHGDEMRNR